VTNDHFDADGLAGVFALNDPVRAEPLAERLVAFAAAGDFDVASDPAAAASVLAAAALVDPERGALLPAEDLADTNRRTARACRRSSSILIASPATTPRSRRPSTPRDG
jgi:hypothetical protein